MTNSSIHLVLILLLFVSRISKGSDGDADPGYRECLGQCEQTGCVYQHCFSTCKQPCVNSSGIGDLYLKWRHACCQSDCRSYCIQNRETQRKEYGYPPVKYHGRWPLKTIFGLQEPASVAFSAINLAIHFTSWLSFRSKQKNKSQYEYATLWQYYAFFQVNMWLWSTIMHTREIEMIKRINISCTVAAIGFSLTMTILRSFSVKDEASKVMVLAPLLAFSTTHILFLNNYDFNYEWNHKVCTVMVVAEVLVWAIWTGFGRHPARWKVLLSVVGSCVVMFLKSLDFPPYDGIIDGQCLSLAAAVPLTWIWWSFINDDTKLRCSNLLRKNK